MEFTVDNLENERAVYYTDDKLLLCIWRTHKGKLVYLLSSVLENSLQESKRFCIKEKKIILIKRPAILEAYNEHMRGVDYFDQYLRYYSLLHGSKKWYLKIAFYFLEVAILNSYIIYQKEYGKNGSISRKEYIVEIIYALLGMQQPEKHRFHLKKRDFKLISVDDPRDCTVCSDVNEKRKRTSYFCSTCCSYVCAVGCYDEHRATSTKN